MADAALLFQWRNDGTSREIHNKKLDASTHLLWVEETLRDPGAKLFIRMVALLEEHMRARHPRSVLVAYVEKKNEASRRTFERLGYQCMEEYESYRYTKQL